MKLSKTVMIFVALFMAAINSVTRASMELITNDEDGVAFVSEELGSTPSSVGSSVGLADPDKNDPSFNVVTMFTEEATADQATKSLPVEGMVSVTLKYGNGREVPFE